MITDTVTKLSLTVYDRSAHIGALKGTVVAKVHIFVNLNAASRSTCTVLNNYF
jgi:hypothetical protein